MLSSTGKPVQSEELRKIESIVNEQIKAELDVYAKEAKLTDAKRVNGLRAVFGEVSFYSFESNMLHYCFHFSMLISLSNTQ